MANKTPIAPSTESSPQTEAYAKADPVSGLDLSEFTPEPFSEPVEQEEESWFDSFWGDDEDEYLERPPQDPEFETLWRRSEKENLIDSKVRLAEIYSNKPLDIEGVRRESELVPVQKPSGVAAGINVAADTAMSGIETAVETYQDVKETGIGSAVLESNYSPVRWILNAGGFVLPTLEYSDVPRSESWTAGYKLAGFLPDTDGAVGDALSDLTGNTFVVLNDLYETLTLDTQRERTQEEQHDFDAALNDLGKAMYSAFADEKILKKAKETDGYFINRPEIDLGAFKLLEGANATGSDFVNIAFPIDIMRRLKENAPKGMLSKQSQMLEVLSDPVSRSALGLAMEVFLDPLMLTGPAGKSVQAAYKGSVYILGKQGARVAGILEQYGGGVGHARHFRSETLKAVVGTAEESAQATTMMREVADTATQAAQASTVKANRFNRLSNMASDEASLSTSVEALKKELGKEINQLEKSAERLANKDDVLSKARYEAHNKKVGELRADIDDLSRSPDAQKVQKYLSAMENNAKTRAAIDTANASELRAFVELAESSTRSSVVTSKSKIPLFGTWHIPFTDKTYNLESQVGAVAGKLNQALGTDSILATAIGKVDDLSVDSATKIQRALDDGLPPYQYLTNSQKFLESAKAVGADLAVAPKAVQRGMKTVGVKLSDSAAAKWGLRAVDTMGRLLGTRHFQAFTAMREATLEMRHTGAKGGFFQSLSINSGRIVRLRRLKPELWDNYQNSVSNYLNQVEVLKGDAINQINFMYHLAGGVDGTGGALSEWRNKIQTVENPRLTREIAELQAQLADTSNLSKVEIDLKRRALRSKLETLAENKRVLSDDYTVNDLVNEVAYLVESGAGVIEDNPWLKGVSKKWIEIRNDLATQLNKPIEDINQALVAMARYFDGDKQAADELYRRLELVQQTLYGREKTLSNEEVTMSAIVDALSVKAGSKMKLLHSVKEKKLAEIIYKTLDIAEGRPFGQEVAQTIDDALLKLLDGDEDLKNEILAYAAGVYGRDPEASLLMFAKEISGDLDVLAERVRAGKSLKKDELILVKQEGIHPLRWDKHPEVPGITPEMSIEEFINATQGKDIEYGAIYDSRTGQQLVAAKGTKDLVELLPNMTAEAIEDIISSRSAIIVHNHPKGWNVEMLNVDGRNVKPEKTAPFRAHQSFSFGDLLSDLVWDAEKSIIGQADGTIWVVDRPKDGWRSVPPGDLLTRYDRRSNAVKESVEPIGQELQSLYDEIDKVKDVIIDRMREDLELIDKTLPNYRSILKLKRDRWTNYFLDTIGDLRNSTLVEYYEEITGARPYRIVSPGRYSGKPPIRRIQQGADVTVERNLLRNRIRQAIQDKKLDTQAAIYEVKKFREGVTESFPTDVLGKEITLKAKAYNANFEDRVQSFIEKHYGDVIAVEDDVYEISEVWVADLYDWLSSEYPNGVPLRSRADNSRVSRTPKEWLDDYRSRYEIPDSITEKDIAPFVSGWALISKDTTREALTRLQRIEKARKRLAGPREISPLRPSKIRKDAAKLKKSRVANVLENLINDSVGVEDATVKIRAAFDELLDVPDDPIFVSMKDKMADTLANFAYNNNYSLTAAIKETKKAGRKLLKEEYEELVEKINKELPKIEVPEVKPDSIPALKDWELKVWDEFSKITSNLSDEETMMVAFAALADSPTVINAKTVGEDHYKALKARYGTLVGRRMGKLPEELKDTKEAFQGLIKHYEDLYIKHGMTFVKTPEEMLRLWGVVNYIPHTPISAKDIQNGYSEAVTTKTGFEKYVSSLDDALSTNLDQRKQRLIAGTMKEVNALKSAKGTEFGIEPVTLLARYYSAAKAISNQEFVYSLLAGGVLKPIGSKSVHDDYLESLANKYKVLPEEEIDKTSAARLEQLISQSITNAERTKLDELSGSLERVDSARRAADRGYVPLFQRASKNLSNDTLVNGNSEQWLKELFGGSDVDERLLPSLIDQIIVDAKKYPTKVREDKFGKLVRDSPVLRQTDEIISVVAVIKAKNLAKNEPMFDVFSAFEIKKKQLIGDLGNRMARKGKTPEQIANAKKIQEPSIELKAWDAVAADMNAIAAEAGLSGHRVRGGEALKNFYAQDAELWNLYIPGTVKQSMEDLFVFNEKSSWTKDVLRKFNNFWKLRVTIIAAAFHARNAVSNQFTNMLDLGIGSLNPVVQFEAARLSSLTVFYDRFGSLENARKIYGMKRGANESTLAFNRRKAQLKLIDSIDTPNATYDLGDGIPYTADEALSILKERNVLSGNMQQFVDIGDFESNLSEIYASAGLSKKLDKGIKFVSAVEDGAILGLPALMTGTVLPIGLPKSIGRGVGRMTENQARITNFIGNVKRTKSYDKAAEHSNKFLFNYNDLTAVQKDWMRLLVPFFTWTQKNVGLQLDMMLKSPYFYSNFNKLLIHQGPELIEQYNAEQAGVPYVPKLGSSKHSLAFRDYHARNYIRFPVPGKPGFYVEGLGLPQEAFFDQMTMIADVAKPVNWSRYDDKRRALRIAGQTHFLLKLTAESLSNYNLFYDQPISDMTSGRFAGQVISTVRKVPGAGDGIADMLTNITGYSPNQYYNARRGSWSDDLYIDGHANYALMSMPWSRVLKDASAASMMYNMTYLDKMPEELRREYSEMNVDPLSDSWKLLDAMTGIRIIAENEAARKRRIDYDIKQREDEMFRRSGVTRTFDMQTLKDQ